MRSQPVVVAVDGTCAGAGAMIALASDLRIGTPNAKTAFLFVRVGLAGCDMGACALLPRVIGQGRAAELLYTGRVMTADEARDWGFFNRVVAPAEVLREAQALARTLADGPTFAHAMTKEMLHREWEMDDATAIEAEAQAQAMCMQTADFRRAYDAFVAKTSPRFEGNEQEPGLGSRAFRLAFLRGRASRAGGRRRSVGDRGEPAPQDRSGPAPEWSTRR